MHHVGQRLSYGNNICTLRYIGELEVGKGEWLGVEWDDDQLGKNDGTYQGRQYFRCEFYGFP